MIKHIHAHDALLERTYIMSKKVKKLRIWPIVFALLAVVAVAGASYTYVTSDSSGNSPNQVTPAVGQDDKKDSKLDNATSKVNSADFKDASLKLQNEVDKLVKAQKWDIKKRAKSEQKVNRAEGKGTIDWWQRVQLISVNSPTSVDKLKEYLTSGLKDKKGIVIREEKDTYEGVEVIRLDIALVDILGGEELNLTTDKIYIMGATPEAVKPAKNPVKGRLALVIDDCGYEIEPLRKMLALKRNFTFAIIPDRPYTKESLNLIKQAGLEPILHLPMEPLDKTQQSESRTIEVSMTDEAIKNLTREYIEQLPGIVGVNNHQGSRATADERVMKAALAVIKSKGLFFLDSNTQPKTIAHKVASNMGIRTNINRAFLDGQADVDYIKKRLRQAVQSAIDNGSYIAICHVRPKTAIALVEVIDELEKMGVEFVFVSTLLK